MRCCRLCLVHAINVETATTGLVLLILDILKRFIIVGVIVCQLRVLHVLITFRSYDIFSFIHAPDDIVIGIDRFWVHI